MESRQSISLALLQEKANVTMNDCKYENSCLKKYKTRQMYIWKCKLIVSIRINDLYNIISTERKKNYDLFYN